MMALAMIVTLSQCKKQNEETEDNTAKVRISCTIPLNNDGKTDFTNILENGTVNWSAETERIYLAIPATQELVELTSETSAGGSTLTFSGNVTAGSLDITGETEYDVWYLGRSQYSKLVDGSITGSIATQSGNLSDLGYHHIAKATVTANGNTLTFNGNFKNQIAIVRLGEESASTSILRGNAIIGTEYSLEYDGDKYDIAITGEESINVTNPTNESYVVLFPNEETNVELKSNSGKKVTFLKGIKAGNIYTVGWEVDLINGHEYVDLGLPSGRLWATCNIGASSPEDYGNYYAWGETSTKNTYYYDNCPTYGLTYSQLQSQGYIDSEGNLTAQYDAATANWGGDWHMPTYAELNELSTQCIWTWTTQNGVKGYKVTSKTNDNYIFLPVAGYRKESSLNLAGNYGYYRSSTYITVFPDGAYSLYLANGDHHMEPFQQYYGQSVRPVCGGGYVEPVTVSTNDVTVITSRSAVCGGNVTTDYGSVVTARGVCWSTTQNPTIEDNKTTDGTGVGSFTSILSDLVPQTTYYVRAYVTTVVGTSYGEQKTFETKASNIINGYECIDLGLPSGLLWATCNVGATSPEEYGNYYAWGETTTKSDYSSSNSATYGLTSSQLRSQGYIDSYGNLTSQHDAATVNWGGDWRMPTYDELNELITQCTWTSTTQNGVKGYKVTSKTNGNYIFLPNAGYRKGSSRNDDYYYGYYWSSKYDSYSNYNAYYLSIYYLNQQNMSNKYRYYGQSVRPVIE